MWNWNPFRRHRPLVVVLTGNFEAQLNELADRVHQRLRARSEPGDNPLQELFKISQEEVEAMLVVPQLRQQLKLTEVIYSLPPRQRSAIIDHVERGWTYKQIARKRGMTERIVLRDLTRAYATLRMQLRSDDEPSSNDQSGRLQAAAGEQLAGVRDSAPHVGVGGGVYLAGTPGGRVPGSAPVQRPDEGGKESGPHEPAPLA